jgi:hypothetical protein
VKEVGCCFSLALQYVQAVFGKDARDKIANRAGPNQNDCKPSSRSCGLVTSGALSLRPAWSVLWATVVVAASAVSAIR